VAVSNSTATNWGVVVGVTFMSPRLRQLLGILVANSNVVVWIDRRVSAS